MVNFFGKSIKPWTLLNYFLFSFLAHADGPYPIKSILDNLGDIQPASSIKPCEPTISEKSLQV